MDPKEADLQKEWEQKEEWYARAVSYWDKQVSGPHWASRCSKLHAGGWRHNVPTGVHCYMTLTVA